MVMSVEQQFQLDLESTRNNNLIELEKMRAKIESIRLAKEVLIENARSKPVDSRDVTVDDIINFSQSLINYYNS